MEDIVTTPDQCDRCLCEECGGSTAQHAAGRCTCEDCTGYPETACTRFHPPARIAILAEQLALLLGAHLNERCRTRCNYAAHAAHHALNDYDHAGDTP